MSSQSPFTAQCEAERSGGWKANVSGLGCEAHAKRLDQLRERIARNIQDQTGLELCDIVVRLEGLFPDALERFHSAHEKIAEANMLRSEAAREIREVVAQLRAEDLTMRDISALLDITPQRVAQLVHSELPKDPR